MTANNFLKFSSGQDHDRQGPNKERERHRHQKEIEKKLKVLDQTLEVFIEEILDQNKLRLKNSPQKLS